MSEKHLPEPSAPSVIVAGGAGYIGSHACKALRRAGFTPVTIDNLSTGHAEAVKWGPFYQGDIQDRDLVGRVIREHRVVGALHFAAFSLVQESTVDPIKYINNNVVAAFEFLKEIMANGVENFIFSSTAAVYGIPEQVPILETSATAPINPYGVSKLLFENVIRTCAPTSNLRYAILRYFNAAGADLDGEIGEDHNPETHLIPNVAKACLGQGGPLRVFGTDYPTRDGTAVRDYIHVVDLAQAHVLALRNLMEGGPSGVMNIGTSHGATVMEIISAAERVLGRKVPHEMQARREGDPPVLIASSSVLRERLGWEPVHSDLDTIIRTAAAWFEAKA